MTEKRKAPEGPEDAHRRKRAAPTIDLTATEVAPAEEPKDPAKPEPQMAQADPLAGTGIGEGRAGRNAAAA